MSRERPEARPLTKRQRRQQRRARGRAEISDPRLLGVLSRRQVLVGTAGLLGIAGIVAVCREPQSPKQFGDGYEYKQLPTPYELVATLDELPQTPIKDLLVARIRPFYTNNPPSIVQTPGFFTEVRRPTLQVAAVDPNRVSGYGTIFEDSVPTVALAESVTRRVPYDGLLSDNELADWVGDRFSNGIPALPLHWEAGETITHVISPRIKLDLPSPTWVSSFPEPDRTVGRKLVKLLMVKEASTLLILDLAMESISQEMQRQGENITARVNVGANVRDIPILPQIMHGFGQHNGRFWSSIDKAGAVLALQAIRGNGPTPDFITRGDKPLATVQKEIERLSLGSTPQEIYRNAMSWCATAPLSEVLPHIGQQNVIP